MTRQSRHGARRARRSNALESVGVGVWRRLSATVGARARHRVFTLVATRSSGGGGARARFDVATRRDDDRTASARIHERGSFVNPRRRAHETARDKDGEKATRGGRQGARRRERRERIETETLALCGRAHEWEHEYARAKRGNGEAVANV